jgi:hypothetical protein
MKKPKNLGFEPVHPKNVLLASVVHKISYLFNQKTYSGFLFRTPKYINPESFITIDGGSTITHLPFYQIPTLLIAFHMRKVKIGL